MRNLQRERFDMKFIRPVGGDLNGRVERKLTSLGYNIVQWTIDSHDWRDWSIEYKTKRFLNNARSYRKKGRSSILLFHDRHVTNGLAESAIKFYKNEGSKFISVTECYELNKNSATSFLSLLFAKLIILHMLSSCFT